MAKINPTKRVPHTRMKHVVMVRDESEDFELLAFENAEAAHVFEACLNDAGYGSGRGDYQLEYVDMDAARMTAGYDNWVSNGQQVVSLAYVQYVSNRMCSQGECDVSGDLLNVSTIASAYVPMEDDDYDILYADDEAQAPVTAYVQCPTAGEARSQLLGVSFNKYPGLFVDKVKSGSLASQMGLTAHTEIAFVNGKDPCKMTVQQVTQALDTEGTVIWFTKCKGGYHQPVVMHEAFMHKGKVSHRVVATKKGGFWGMSMKQITKHGAKG